MYPKQVFFILIYELLERFTYYSVRTILVLFFNDALGFSEHLSTGIFHGTIFIAYIMPLIGAWIADSFYGKFKTIMFMSVIYILGSLLLASSSFGYEEYTLKVVLSLAGLFLIAIGTGGVKPCITPFGADQYSLPEQEKELNTFFSLFYWFINAGAVFACFFAPFIRSNVKCFGESTCYFIVFGISVVTMTLATGVFVAGKQWYKAKAVEYQVVNNFLKCLWHSLVMRIRSTEKKQHWLDHADDQYSLSFIEDVKTILRVFVVILPTVVFWALNDKQSSRWIFQARQLDGHVWKSFKIEPDQMVTLSALFVLPLVPLFEKVVYPCFEKIGIMKSLFQRMYVGSFLMAGTSVLASALQYSIKHYKEQKYVLHIAWQIPQYLVLVCAEILFVINVSNFIYRQSPPKMETLVSSLWLLTISLGNLLAFIIAAFGIPCLEIEFLVDAGLMVLAAILLIFTTSRYQWRTFSEPLVDIGRGESFAKMGQ